LIDGTPIDIARGMYDRSVLDFDRSLCWNHAKGWVIDLPHLFAMGYFYEENEKLICFIEVLVGNASLLLRFNSFSIDILEFQRNPAGKVKRYNFDKFTERL